MADMKIRVAVGGLESLTELNKRLKLNKKQLDGLVGKQGDLTKSAKIWARQLQEVNKEQLKNLKAQRNAIGTGSSYSKSIEGLNHKLKLQKEIVRRTSKSTKSYTREVKKLTLMQKKLGMATGKITGGLARMRLATSGVQRGLGVLRNQMLLVTFATAGIIRVVTKVIKAFAKQEEVEAKLNQVLKSTGNAVGMTADEIKRLASEMQKSTKFGDEVVLSGQNMLLTFTNIGRDVFPRATETMLNLSEAMGVDVKQSAIQLGKALNDPILGVTALRRVGVQLTDTQSKQIKKFVELGDVASAQNIILDELEREFGGLAKAAGDTVAGAMAKAGNAVGDMSESIGAFLSPAVIKTSGNIQELSEGIGEFFQRLSETTLETTVRHLKEMGVAAKDLMTLDLAVGLETAVENLSDTLSKLKSGLLVETRSLEERRKATNKMRIAVGDLATEEKKWRKALLESKLALSDLKAEKLTDEKVIIKRVALIHRELEQAEKMVALFEDWLAAQRKVTESTKEFTNSATDVHHLWDFPSPWFADPTVAKKIHFTVEMLTAARARAELTTQELIDANKKELASLEANEDGFKRAKILIKQIIALEEKLANEAEKAADKLKKVSDAANKKALDAYAESIKNAAKELGELNKRIDDSVKSLQASRPTLASEAFQRDLLVAKYQEEIQGKEGLVDAVKKEIETRKLALDAQIINLEAMRAEENMIAALIVQREKLAGLIAEDGDVKTEPAKLTFFAEDMQAELDAKKEFYTQMQSMATDYFTTLVSAKQNAVKEALRMELDELHQSRKYKMASDAKKEKLDKEVKNRHYADLLKWDKAQRGIATAEVAINYVRGFSKEVARQGLFAMVTAAPLFSALAASQIAMIWAQPKPQKFAKGGEFVTNRPEMIMVGEAGREHVKITPIDRPADRALGSSNVTVNFSGNVLSKDFIEDEAIPQIKEALRRGGDIGLA